MNEYVCKYVCNFERVDLFEVDCTKPAFTYIIVFFRFSSLSMTAREYLIL